MIKAHTDPIILQEYTPLRLPAHRITKEQGKQLWQNFGDKITITEPSFKTDDQWELTSLGWVGFIPLSEDLAFYLQPKVPLQNLFGMWEYAYRLRSFQFLDGYFQCETLQQFYEPLASVLAKRILDRSRKGYYQEYVNKREDLSYLRGRLDIRQMLRKPCEPRPRCNDQENTTDVEENQILVWTLSAILRSGYCTERVLPILRECYRSIGQIVSLLPFTPDECHGRLYNRLNQDYQPLHLLCRFFLDNTGPSYEIGNHMMLPFLVNMAGLFELFVAEWVRSHLPSGFGIKAQDNVTIDQEGRFSFRIDLVLYNQQTGQPICVLDTKYKSSEGPASDDIAQVAFYAMTKQCGEAVLVYTKELTNPLDEVVNGIRIRTASYILDGDLDTAGKAFLDNILEGQNYMEVVR